MKISDIINNLNKTKTNEYSICLKRLSDAFGMYIDINYPDEDIIKGYFIVNWYCTDQSVGQVALFYKDVFFGIMSKSARKNEPHFYFVKDLDLTPIKEYLKSLEIQPDEVELDYFELDEEFGHCTVSYSSQLMHTNLIHNGKLYEVDYKLTREKELLNPFRILKDVYLINENGESVSVPLEECTLPFNTNSS